MHKEPGFSEIDYEEEDIWHEPEIHLVTALGICLIRCQQIEHYIAHSFLFGISKRQKKKYVTITDLTEGWEKKTLGNMIKCIEEAYEIDPIVKQGIELFLSMRNRLVHGLTTSEEFNIATRWGQKELLAFLAFFDIHSRVIRLAFRAAFHASMYYGITHMNNEKKIPKNLLSKKQKEEAGMFPIFFKIKSETV
jgi:hypothetical protein